MKVIAEIVVRTYAVRAGCWVLSILSRYFTKISLRSILVVDDTTASCTLTLVVFDTTMSYVVRFIFVEEHIR